MKSCCIEHGRCREARSIGIWENVYMYNRNTEIHRILFARTMQDKARMGGGGAEGGNQYRAYSSGTRRKTKQSVTGDG